MKSSDLTMLSRADVKNSLSEQLYDTAVGCWFVNFEPHGIIDVTWKCRRKQGIWKRTITSHLIIICFNIETMS